MRNSIADIRYRLMAAVAMAVISSAGPAEAQETPRQEYQIEAQPLAEALKAVGRQSGREVMFPGDAVRGKRAPRLSGSYTADEAIRALLAGTDLQAEFKPDVVIIRGRSAPPAALSEQLADGDDILVTGSRIRSVVPTSKVIVLSQARILESGQTNLGDAVRSLPQNFGGGQNPGVVMGSRRLSDENVNSASTINLRGLGPDATLTLLNGHRLSYDSAVQGVDISAIPLAAVDRVEIMTDGASAIYGSDAVGGVANILLKRDFDGLSTSGRLGGTTNGGNFQQQYDIVGGSRWGTGGIIVALNYARSTAVTAQQRTFTRELDGTATLLPYQKSYGAIFGGHQQLGDGVKFEIDGFYNHRQSVAATPLSTSGTFKANGTEARPVVDSYSISPRVTANLSNSWTTSLSATFGSDKTELNSSYYSGGSLLARFPGYYKNSLVMAEFTLEGPLLHLPGGDTALAVGGGYRSNRLSGYLATVIEGDTQANQRFSNSRDSYHLFGELYLPFVSPALAIPGIDRFSLTAALRYEKYPGTGEVAAPKIGVIYAPVPDVQIKGSWGKSFKAPTLFQQFRAQRAQLLPPDHFDSTGYPARAAVLNVDGGNRDLKPERADTWTASILLAPRAIPNARLELSYFNIRYRDRIVVPVSSQSNLLANPLYVDLIDFSPTVAKLDGFINAAAAGLMNYTAYPYNPSNVVAIIDNRDRNSSRQNLHGVDVFGDYQFNIGEKSKVTLTGVATYLHSTQQLRMSGAIQQLAGTIFNPPHWRGRAGIAVEREATTITAYVNYVGSVADDRFPTSIGVDAMTTLDLTARLRSPASAGPLANANVLVSVSNVFGSPPPKIRAAAAFAPPYDSTNYSAIGRFISVTIEKRW